MVNIGRNLKHVLVDMDNVLIDLEKGFLHAWRENHPNLSYIPLEQRTTFFPKPQYVKEFGPEYESHINELCYAPGFLLNLPEIEGAFNALIDMDNLGHKVTIVTSPLNDPTQSLIEKPQYIEQRLGSRWTREDRLMIRSDKDAVIGDYLIDDKSEVKKNPHTQWEQILFLRPPYNDASPLQKRMTWKSDYTKIMDL